MLGKMGFFFSSTEDTFEQILKNFIKLAIDTDWRCLGETWIFWKNVQIFRDI